MTYALRIHRVSIITTIRKNVCLDVLRAILHVNVEEYHLLAA